MSAKILALLRGIGGETPTLGTTPMGDPSVIPPIVS
jgi:hypothetical protein